MAKNVKLLQKLIFIGDRKCLTDTLGKNTKLTARCCPLHVPVESEKPHPYVPTLELTVKCC